MTPALYRVVMDDLGLPFGPVTPEMYCDSCEAEHGWAPVLVPSGDAYVIRYYPVPGERAFEGEPGWDREEWIAAGARQVRVLEPVE